MQSSKAFHSSTIIQFHGIRIGANLISIFIEQSSTKINAQAFGCSGFLVDFLHSGIGHFEIVNKKTDRNLLLVRSSSIICKREILHKTVICDKNIEHMEAMGVSISGSISLLSFMFYLPKRK